MNTTGRAVANRVYEIKFLIGEFLSGIWPLTLFGLMWLGWAATFMFITFWAIPVVQGMSSPPTGALLLLYCLRVVTAVVVAFLSLGFTIEMMRGRRRPNRH